MNHLKSTSWLFDNLDNEKLIILNASKEQSSNQIKNAIYFDITNVFSDTSCALPNTFPITDEFEKNAQDLGINQDSILVVYDNKGIFFSPRVWWLFHTFGFKNVFVLDGGLPEWEKQNYPTEVTKINSKPKGNFKAAFNRENVIKSDKLLKNITTKQFQVIDARASGRFDGTTPEPRKGLKNGHIPNSKNLPYMNLLENGKMKSIEQLQRIFDNLELDDQDFVFTCGSGITACILLLASHQIGFENKFIYDGSWTEYSQLENAVIHTL